MDAHGWVTLVACAGELALAVLALLRGGRSPLALPLALLSLNLFAWNFFALAYEVSGALVWRWLDVSVSPLGSPLALHFLFTFMGRRRQLRWVLWASYAYFGALCLSTVASFASDAARDFAGSTTWAALHLAGLVPAMVLVMVLLVVHLSRANTVAEQMRARLLLLALVILATLASSELLADLHYDVPRLGSLGSLAATAILSAIALRFDLLERDVSATRVVYAFAVGALAVLAYLGLFYFLRTNAALLAIGLVTVTLTLFAITQRGLAALAARRDRMAQLATLGRFSAQMAHDLKNPLAALQGAVQFLRAEREGGRSLDAHADFLALMNEQIDRLKAVVERYQRLGRIEPVRTPVDVGELVRATLALQRFGATAQISVRAELEPHLPTVQWDRDLMAGALENLVQNALEAMPEGGSLVVRARRASAAEGEGVALEVCDTGAGMDVRTRERAFDDFFTTKATGSGMGLAFVRRVVEAHGGETSLVSTESRGTTVRMRLPLD